MLSNNNPDSPFNRNQDMVKMRQEIADRSYRLKMISGIISIGTAIAGLALAMLVPGMGGLIAGLVIGLGGPLITTMVTEKEQQKLAIDREYIESYMSGKNYWGEGYRKEVAEHGYAGPRAPNIGAPHPHHGHGHGGVGPH